MKYVAIVSALALVLVGAGCQKKSSSTANTNVSANVNATTNTNVAVSTNALTVTTPTKDAELTSPFSISGTVKQGTVVFIGLKNEAGRVIASTSAKVVNGAWTIKAMAFSVSTSTRGTLEVYQQNKTTGAKLFDTLVPVTLK